MMSIREYLNWNSSYSAINREERNLAAILFHVLLLGDNLKRFLALTGKLMGEYGEELSRVGLKDAFNGVVTLTFEQIRNARNDIAHPSGREFTWNEVSGLLHNYVQYFIYANRIIAFLRAKQRTG